ncbi:MAG: peptidase M3 [Rhodobacterales bacterium]|nr:MAG: peptidase M3 [Rhodobacterales bacterium]
MTNALLSDWHTDFGLPPFSEISDADFAPALEAAMTAMRAEIEAIAQSDAAPTFANTIKALEEADALLSKVGGVFFNLAGADANPARDAVQAEFAPKFAALSSEVAMNPALFQRIEAVWQGREEAELSPVELRVLDLHRREFVRSGALLNAEDQARMKEIKERLSVLSTRFVQNLLSDEKSWSMEVSEALFDALPGFLQAAMRGAGSADAPVVTLSRSVITPFLMFCSDRAARAMAYEAYVSRGANGGETDNRAIAAEVLQLRAERAALLGYADFATYKLEEEMAKTPEAVDELLRAVWEPARRAAETDAEILEAMLVEDGFAPPLEPWDWHYYSEKRRVAEHALDEAEIKSYLGLDNMIEAAFDVAKCLFSLEFRELDGAYYHPDVRAWEVMRDGEHMAVFLGDYFARGSKRSGAWCSTMRPQHGAVRPIVVNVCNFAKPEAGQAALLSWDDARTLFHEFGHALHNILSDVPFKSIAGTSVARDFVELPSQLYEHWLELPEVLDRFALNVETGAPMPADLRDRLLAASHFNTGFGTVEYVASAMVDLAFHTGPAPADPMQKQAEVLEEIGMPHAIRMRHATPHFAHVFAGDGYAAGYYSYMWSEVMDADAFAAFEEAGGPFDREMAQRLETHILSAGAQQDAAEAYRAFRGRMPGVEALLKGRGLA